LRLARAEHHVPQALRGQGAMPLGLASTEGLGLAPRARAWTCGHFIVFGARYGAFPLGAGDGRTARSHAAATLDSAQTRQCWPRRLSELIEDHGLQRSAVLRCNRTVHGHCVRRLCLSSFACGDMRLGIGCSVRLVQMLAELRCLVARPNVGVEAGPTVRRQARAGENVHRTTGPGLVACRWASPRTTG